MAKIVFSSHTLILIAAFTLSTTTSATSYAGSIKASEGTEPTRHKLVLPKMRRVTILENPRGKFMEGLSDPPQKCADVFVLTEKQVRRFFSQTDRVSQHDYFEVLPLSSCSVTGTVEFVNGDKARWSINSFQNGTLFFEDEKKNMFLYCPRCTWEPFNL